MIPTSSSSSSSSSSTKMKRPRGSSSGGLQPAAAKTQQQQQEGFGVEPFAVDTSTTAIYVDSHDTRSETRALGATWNGAKIALINGGSAQDLIFNNATNYAFVPPEFRSTKNFGFQKYLVPPDAISPLELSSPKRYTFTLKPHQDILLDYFLSVSLPDIYSPIYHPCPETGEKWSPYDFRWIDDPCEIIAEYDVYAGNVKIHSGTGKTIRLPADRDLSLDAREKFNEMVGAVPEVTNPAFAGLNRGAYPNVFFRENAVPSEPSILARTLHIPLHLFFPPCGFPLFLLGANTPVVVSVTLRPIADWFRVRDVFDHENEYPLVRPDFAQPQFGMYRFLQPPPGRKIAASDYTFSSRVNSWDANLHIVATYVAISEQEKQAYRSSSRRCVFWMRTFVRQTYPDVQGVASLTAPAATGFATSLIVAAQRNDVSTRNEWSNYTNWPYLGLKPTILENAPTEVNTNLDESMTGLRVTSAYSPAVEKDVLLTMTLLFEGNERETTLPCDLCRRIDLFTRCPGRGTDGVIYYQFAKNSPLAANAARISGVQNWQTLNRVQVRVSTATPMLSPEEVNRLLKKTTYYCDPFTKKTSIIQSTEEYSPYDYKYDVHVFVEMLNSLLIDTNTGFIQLLHPV